ncbi:MAG: hypothetical protein H7245_07800 [Candidatus Saccharibacteria bacterium]|nr:hypothetical protein [Pseudorhodobacter sp.]
MMLTQDDLRAAVAKGILTEAQTADLIGFAEARRLAKAAVTPVEEPFVLFKGFNEIFVVVGLTILFIGWVGVAMLFGLNMQAPAGAMTVLLSVVTLAGLAATAQYFTVKRRMIAPSIALSVMTLLTAVVLGMTLIGIGGAFQMMLVAAVVAVVMAGFYAVFRVPFAAALIAGAAFVAVWTGLTAAGVFGSDAVGFFVISESGPLSLMTVVFGLVVFAIAMRLDLSDPMRVSTRSATAFWLHIVAAPAIVNTVALNLMKSGGLGAQVALLAFLLVIAVIAIVIDRRSFLVSGSSYSVILASTVFDGGAAYAVLVLGLILVLLGAQWDRLRGRIMAALPSFPGKSNLPPFRITA